MSPETERWVRAALSVAVEPGEPDTAGRVAEAGVGQLWADARAGRLGPAVAERAARIDPAELARRAGVLRIRYAVPGDTEWPTDRLADLSRGTGGPPLGLWLRGPLPLDEVVRHAVAVVGARACTAYGEGVAADLAGGLADAGVGVISGGAYGIDAAAHRGALAGGTSSYPGRTVAVLACGVDVAYPRGNARLFDALGQQHLLVSELPPGAHPTRSRFLTRNRLIAALGTGVVVVEAAVRSGARNTAGWAERCGRPLMAVPGPVHSALSAAPHLMIREQQAVLVTSAAEVLEVIAPMGQHTLVEPRGELRSTDRLSRDQLAVFEALRPSRSASTDEVATGSGLGVAGCLAELIALEELGLVRADARGWRLR